MARMVDMRRSRAEKQKEAREEGTPKVFSEELPDVPWGMRLRLTEEELDKLDLNDEEEPEIGDRLKIVCVAKITSVSKNATEDSENRTIEMSIIKMRVVDTEDPDGKEDD